MEIIILDRESAGKLLRSEQNKNITHIMSFHDPKNKPCSGFSEHTAQKVQFAFHDVLTPNHDEIVPNKTHIRNIINFCTVVIKDDSHVLFHCAAGRSRSAAAAYILLCIKNPNQEEKCIQELIRLRPIAHPNLLMIQYADRLLGCNGKMIDALVKYIHY